MVDQNPDKTVVAHLPATGSYSGKHKKAWSDVLLAISVWVGHVAVVCFILLGLWALEMLVEYLWGKDSCLFFDFIPVEYIFDGADLAVIIWLSSYGVWNVVKAYRGK